MSRVPKVCNDPNNLGQKSVDKGGWRQLRQLTKISNCEPKSLCVCAVYTYLLYLYMLSDRSLERGLLYSSVATSLSERVSKMNTQAFGVWKVLVNDAICKGASEIEDARENSQ